MPIPSLRTFELTTHNDAVFERARGPNIRRVDHALKRWWAEKGRTQSGEERAALLANIVTECSRYLKKKRKSANKQLLIKRKIRVEELGQAALDELAGLGRNATTIAFDRRKLKALGYPGGRPRRGVQLSGSYAHERTLYLKSGKTSAPSATLLHKYITQGDPEMFDDRYTEYYGRFGSKRFDELSVTDFAAFQKLAEKLGHQNEVRYLKKGDRLAYWAIADRDGRLRRQTTGQVVDTARQNIPFTWTMDEYGNLFLGPGEGFEHQFNHSSYNAGKDVICGGTIKVEKGLITFIDNSSGHYKPGENDLLTALRLLADDGTDLTKALVKVMKMQGGRLVELQRVFKDDDLVPPTLQNR